ISKINVILLIFTLAMMLILALEFFFFQNPLKKVFQATKTLEQQIVGEMNEHFEIMELITLYNCENDSIVKFDSKFKNMISYYLKQKRISLLGSSLGSILVQFWLLGVFLISVFLLSNSDINVGQFISVYAFTSLLPSTWGAVLASFWSYQDFSVSLRRYQNFVDEHSVEDGTKHINEIESIRIKIDEYFHYKGNKHLHVDTKLKQGTLTVLKGKNGSGKTTLIRMLTKLLPIGSGIIEINHKNVNTISKRSLRGSISIATQTPYILNSSIEENILMGNKGYNEILFNQLIELFDLDNIMKKLNITIDSNLYQKNILLSGGEKQKINLFRALIKNSPVIILDEPLTNLDIDTTTKLIKYIEQIKKEKIIIVISHDNLFDHLSDQYIELED
ncbi:ABC transporter ATP-binding protein, partial [Paenibacillus sp. FSL R7-0179]|uniref:ABC transporter ATP-binding protein n=1 Tax=Paenibacillus sp. FSL R7-0179 TaxID=2921672 RepID=UPI0030FA33E2